MNEKVCRLCLQTISNNSYQAVEGSLMKFMKLNTDISKDNVMCIECASCIRIFSDFTSGCVYMGGRALPLSDLENDIKLDPEPIETTSNPKLCMETEIKCSFCKKNYDRQDLISLEESKENKFLVNLLQQYILETNFKNTEELVTCETCLAALQGGLSIILKCLEVEKKINKYIELEETDDKGQIELKEVQQFAFKPILKLENDSFSLNELEDRSDQIKEEYTSMVETEIKYEKQISDMELIIKKEVDDIKSEPSDCNITDIKLEQNDWDGFQDPFIENKTTIEPLLISETRKSKDCINQHLLTVKNPLEIEMIKCELCPREVKCKDVFKRHLLTHKSPLEIKKFKCELCPYETKRKYDFKRHLLNHKSPSEIKMFRCELCSYEAKLKGHLKDHLLTHKSPSEIKMFKCELCTYEAKRKVNLNRHLLTHKSPSEIKMFKCELCSFEAKCKSYLKFHLLTHKSPSEIKMFKCELCPYEAKRKVHVKKHLLTHKSPSELKMVKCELCPYETKRKYDFKRHLLNHKSPSEIEMFKCELCSYEAKLKGNLKNHLLTHKSPSEIKMFKCKICPYEAKSKDVFKKHLLAHKSASLKAKRKHFLKSLILPQKSVGDGNV